MLYELGYFVGPMVSGIWYVIPDAAFWTDADVSVLFDFNASFTAWMNMSAPKYPPASVSEPGVPGLNASTSALNWSTPFDFVSYPANCMNTYEPARAFCRIFE